MNVLRSIAMAFLMFSRIPMPRIEWKKENMRYMLAALPLVGAVIGAAIVMWTWLCLWLKVGSTLYAAGITLIPLIISGGIHMDGFCDTCDALASHQSAERKKEILKDPHTGAFALIGFGMYVLGYFAFASEAQTSCTTALLIGIMHMLSRSTGALLSTIMSSAHEGLLSSFKDASSAAAAWILLCAFILCAAGLIIFGSFAGAAAVAAAAVTFFICRHIASKQFGGMSGDIAGFTIQLSELIMLGAYIFISKAVQL